MNKNPENIQPVSLNNLYYFNAHTRSDEDVIKTFIVRKDILQELEKGIRNEKKDSIPQHYLIIGTRGMGKSTLLKRLEIRLREIDMRNKYIPILFPEEQYNVDRISKFWLNSLDALADTFELEKNEREVITIDQLIISFSEMSDENTIADDAYDAFKAICQKYNRRPVFLIDNIDLLFEGISKDQQFKLRKILTGNGAPIFVGASTHNPDASLNYEAPFYDAFDIIYLNILKREEMRELLVQLAIQTNREDSIREVYTQTAQLNALYSLTGGNPRIGLFIFQLISNGLSDKIFENLNSLLDLITPLYKSNFEQLSKQAQLIVDALALHWDPCDLDQLSHLTRLENNQLSSQLDRLIKSSWVERSSRFSEDKKIVAVKNKNYSIRERFFNIWYIMRRASRRQRGDLKSLTRFLETFYAPEHLTVEKRRILDLIKNNPDADKVAYGLALSRVHIREEQENEMENEIYKTILEKAEGDQGKIAQYLHPDHIPFNIYEEYIIKNGKWINQINQFIEAKEFEKALSLIQTLIKKSETNSFIWSRYADILILMDKNADAEEAYLKAIEIDNSDPYNWNRLGDYYAKEREFEKAEKAYKKTIQLDNRHKYMYARSSLGNILRKVKRYQEAEEVLSQGILINEKDNLSAYYLGFLFLDLNKTEEAEKAFEEAVKRKDNAIYQWAMYARALRKNKKYTEVEIAYKKALEIDSKLPSIWDSLGDLYNMDLKEYELAETSYRKAIEIDPLNLSLWEKLGYLLQYNLNKYEEAEKVYKHLTDINNTDESWYNLAKLLLLKSQKIIEAEKAFKKAIEINPQNALAWGWIGILYHLTTKKYEEAQAAYRTALNIRPDLWVFRSEFGHLEHDHFKNYIEAEDSYLEVIKSGKSETVLHDYLFLLRDKLNKMDEAKQVFESNEHILVKSQDIWLLQKGLFALYESNWGVAKENWYKALSSINGVIPNLTFNNWNRAVAITQKLGYGKRLIELFEKNGYDRQFRPFFEALKTLEIGSEDYLLNVAEEIREPAKEIYKYMNHYKQ